MVMVVRDHSLTTFSKLHKVMGLTEDKMIASMDVKRGQMLLDVFAILKMAWMQRSQSQLKLLLDC